ncbi:uncharacterized protein LOC109832459 [Asparagus officinalis]|uniref:uncharacterized protein LOC109832459 n=1 Tax=Asparagus officinalis TaxID=4686 RepID=UPI00098E7B23|nr:uncharacterized protein LOC109832459 [Asparagus officinalis]
MFRASGFFEEGEIPPGPVSPGADNMDCLVQQMCDALHDGSLGIDLNIDLEQMNNVEPVVPCSGHPADVAMEGPSFSKPDAGLLADMLAEQTSIGTERPFLGNDSSTGTYLILLLLPDLLFD